MNNEDITAAAFYEKGVADGLRQGALNGKRKVLNALRKGKPVYRKLARRDNPFQRCEDVGYNIAVRTFIELFAEIEKNV